MSCWKRHLYRADKAPTPVVQIPCFVVFCCALLLGISSTAHSIQYNVETTYILCLWLLCMYFTEMVGYEVTPTIVSAVEYLDLYLQRRFVTSYYLKT